MAVRMQQADFSHVADFLSLHFPSALKDKYTSNVYSLFTLKQEILSELVQQTVDPVHWQTSAVFAGVTKDYFPALEDAANKHGCRLDSRDLKWANLYYATKEDFVWEARSFPDDFTLGELSEEHAKLVFSTWPFANTEESLSYLKSVFKNCPSVALFDSKRNVIAFEVMMFYGAMGMLYVMPEHRRRGYASYVTSVLAKKLFDIGITPFVYLEDENERTVIFHEKIGFRKAHGELTSWVTAKPYDGDFSDHISRKYCV